MTPIGPSAHLRHRPYPAASRLLPSMMEASHTDNLSEPADSADDSADSAPTINTSLPFEDVDLDDPQSYREVRGSGSSAVHQCTRNKLVWV